MTTERQKRAVAEKRETDLLPANSKNKVRSIRQLVDANDDGRTSIMCKFVDPKKEQRYGL